MAHKAASVCQLALQHTFSSPGLGQPCQPGGISSHKQSHLGEMGELAGSLYRDTVDRRQLCSSEQIGLSRAMVLIKVTK